MATILGTSGPNVIPGTNDPGDVIFARAGNDLVNANAGHDLVFGELGNDVLNGGLGDDRLNGGLGNDVLNGGVGSDTADYGSGTIDPPGPVGPQSYIGATAGVTVNLNLASAQNTGGAGVDTLLNIENVLGTNFNDVLTGNGGNNVLSGRAGNDQLNGGAGNDQLTGGSGNDLLNGGTGSDTASYATAVAGVTVSLNLAGAQNTGGAGVDTLLNIENLIGTDFNDTLTGNSANNMLWGLNGNDQLSGGAGNDLLTGGSGNDLLNGGAGSDTASYATATAGVTVGNMVALGGEPQDTGGAGIDTLFDIENLTGSKFNDILSAFELGGTLNGGAGNDQLTVGDGVYMLNGGSGKDVLEVQSFISTTVTFDYNAVSDSPAGEGKDIIIGFIGLNVSEGHDGQIDLSTIDANVLLAGNQAFLPGQLSYVGGILSANIIGTSAAPDLQIQLVGAPALVIGGAGTDILL